MFKFKRMLAIMIALSMVFTSINPAFASKSMPTEEVGEEVQSEKSQTSDEALEE